MRIIAMVLATACMLAIAGSAAAQTSLDVITNPIPQGYANTCQSYALGFALSRAGAAGFDMNSIDDVRQIETKVRQAINQAVVPPETAYSHSVWVRAVKSLTGDSYVLNRQEYSSADDLMDDIVAKTGISNAATLGSTVSILTSQTPVMTTFNSIGTNNYSTGHIVTIFGLDRPSGPVNSVPKLLLLNSAVKGPSGYKFACSMSDLPGDQKYTGAVRLEPDYDLKTFGGKYVLFWITPK